MVSGLFRIRNPRITVNEMRTEVSLDGCLNIYYVRKEEVYVRCDKSIVWIVEFLSTAVIDWY